MSGSSEATTLLKTNFMGYSGGPTAFGVIRFLKTSSNHNHPGNHAVEGGIIFLLAVRMPRGGDAGAMIEVGRFDNEKSRGHYTATVNFITSGQDLFEEVDGSPEFSSEVSTEQGPHWTGAVEFGLTSKITPDVQLRPVINIGVTKAAPDTNAFAGHSQALLT